MSAVRFIQRAAFVLIALILVVGCAAPTPAAVPTVAPTQPPQATKAPAPAATTAPAATAAPASKYSEAPMLAEQVKAGKPPPIDQRLPDNPLVVKADKVGKYGGTWRMGMLAGTDDPSFYKIFAYDPLVRWNPEWTDILPNLAEKWDASADATTYTFHLRKGCGKTTIGRCVMRAYDPTAGQIFYQNEKQERVDLAALGKNELKTYRRQLRMIFQDPYSSLNPRMTVLDIVGEPLKVHNVAHGAELEDRVARLLKRVGLHPEYMRRYPHAFSGGQRQRIGIVRALALDPRIVVADEAVSALDVSVQAQILNLLEDLQDELNLTYLFISHDLSVVEYVADRVAVMYVGKLVEMTETAALFANPKHPYTEALLSAVPKPDPTMRSKRSVLEGDVADPSNPPSGCYFHPRCQYAQDRCKTEMPALREVESDRFVACHRAEELSLRGVPQIAN